MDNQNHPSIYKALGTFSIKDIEAVSGIRCHTLRIWEQRYGILSPKRTDTNIRYYDDDDLKLILNISILNQNGYKISEISKMSRDQINEKIVALSCNACAYDCQIKGLVKAMMVFDEHAFDKIITTNTLQIGFEETMLRIVFPFLVEIGILWQVGSIFPAHEHFATHIIKQKLYVAIDGNMGRYAINRKRFLLFLPNNEQHGLGLLFANYIIRSRGHEVLYLGQEVPFSEMKQLFCAQKCPEFVFTLLTCAHPGMDKQQFVNSLASHWKKSQILLSGLQFLTADIEYPENTKLIRRTEDFITFVDSLSAERLN